MLRRAAVAAAVLLTALTAVAAASADIVTSTDAQGRTITFDVRTTGVDVEWYAALLRNAAHGDEISRVTIRVVARDEIRTSCGQGAVACYGNSLMIVPAGQDDTVAHALVHEYGHHLDSNWPVAGVRELNGTPAWWAARGMAQLVSSSQVAFNYSLGWDHSIGEIFAEDYAYLFAPNTRYQISWLSPPDATLRATMLAELGGAPDPTTPPPTTTTTPPPPQPPTAPPATPTRPVNVTRSGRLGPGERRTIPFQLLGPGRRVTVAAAVAGRAPRVSIEILCGGARVAGTALTTGRTATLDQANLGPATCEAALVSTDTTTRRYVVNLRLSLAS